MKVKVLAAKEQGAVTHHDGVITDGSWAYGPITKCLEFKRTSQWLALESKQNRKSTLQKLSFGGWFSPSAADATERNVCHKSGHLGAIITQTQDSYSNYTIAALCILLILMQG